MTTIPATAVTLARGALRLDKNFSAFVTCWDGNERSENRRLHREIGRFRQTDPETFAENRARRLPAGRGDHEMVDAPFRLQRHDVRNGGVQRALRLRLLESRADSRP